MLLHTDNFTAQLQTDPVWPCRIREEVLEREEIEATKLQLGKRRRQGAVKRLQGRGGAAKEVARLDPKKHRRQARGAVKVHELRDAAAALRAE